MRRTVSADPAEVRAAVPADYDIFARLFLELGPEFPVPSAEEWRDGLAAKSIVATHDGEFAGYAVGVPFGTLGHVSQLVVAPHFRRRGIGRVLLERLAARFLALGCDGWQLNVKRENVAAYELYRCLGFERVSTCTWISLGAASIERLPSMICRVRPIAAADDAVVDDVFGLRRGQMAWSRGQVGTLLHEVLDGGGRRIGFGVYLPAIRFVVPLRLKRPETLASLLASFPAAAEEGARIGVEENDALAALALRCGGTIDLETDRLVAPLVAP